MARLGELKKFTTDPTHVKILKSIGFLASYFVDNLGIDRWQYHNESHIFGITIEINQAKSSSLKYLGQWKESYESC